MADRADPTMRTFLEADERRATYERARDRQLSARERAREAEERILLLGSGQAATVEDALAAEEAAARAALMANDARDRAAIAYRRASAAHRRAAVVADRAGHEKVAVRHRIGAEADDRAATSGPRVLVRRPAVGGQPPDDQAAPWPHAELREFLDDVTVGGSAEPAPDLEDLRRLRRENRYLHRTLVSRAMIEQAKGIVMAQQRCTPDEAFEFLTRLSQDAYVSVGEVAEALVHWATGRSE